MYFTILRAKGGGFFFRIRGANNETIAVSEVYTSVAAAQHTIGVIKSQAAGAFVHDMT